MSGLSDRIDAWRYDLERLLDGRERAVVGSVGAVLAMVLVGTAAWWWFAVRWTPPPSIFDSPVDDVLGYLAMDDFSQLSLEERMAYLGDFANRFRGAGQEESAAAAAFLAGVTGPTRETMRQNARTLAKDVLLDGARGYFAAADADKAKYLDDWLARWQRMAEEMARGEARPLDDAARAREIRGQVQEDMARERDPDDLPPLDSRMTARFLGFWQSDVESASTPREQGQIIRFMEDLGAHLARPGR
jgi:hypothetical protein